MRRFKHQLMFFGKFWQINFPALNWEIVETNLIQNIYILEIVLLLTNNMFCISEYLGLPKYMTLVLKFVFIVYKPF